MNSKLVPVILCGGSGTRLWPLSRTAYPKQLIPLVNEKSMLQNTLLRLQGMEAAAPLVICNQEYRFMAAEQMRAAGCRDARLFLEPAGRNTAPAAVMAALSLQADGDDPVLLVMPADHVMTQQASFIEAVQAGCKLAEAGQLVTFGVMPARPETGYGYILKGQPLDDQPGYHVQRFVEKPSLAQAEEYIASGNYLWNSGIFMFRASVFLAAVQTYAQDLLAGCQAAFAQVTRDMDFYRLGEAFISIRSESIDYAVMEHANNIVVVPLDADWSDVGTWDALWQVAEKDINGNVMRGDVYADHVTNSYLRAEHRMLAVAGLENIAVIETPDAVLVMHKAHSQSMKTLIDTIKNDNRDEVHMHERVYRPWGYYDSLNKHECYQVKHIVVQPGAKLSLQLHHHRSEHWIVIAGTATVTRGDETLDVRANESIYIPAKTRHRIENAGMEPLHLIEVQTGSYFGEDDIIRLDDVYGRQEKVNGG